MKNRQIIERVIHVIKFIGKRGLRYRGHENEAAYSLEDDCENHGNFFRNFETPGKI